jgi:hypothetical protein
MGSGSPQRSLNERIPFGMLTQILGRRYEWNQRACRILSSGAGTARTSRRLGSSAG